MTQKELGNIVGLSQALVSKIEDGKQRINLDFICLVAEVLDCGVINIFQRAKDNMEKDEEEAERKGEQNKAKRISVNRPVII